MSDTTTSKKRPKRAAPWAIRGVTAEARNAAMMAAKREGLTLGEWLDRGIRQLVKERRTTTPAEPIEETLKRILAGQSDIQQRLEAIEGGQDEDRPKKGGFVGLFKRRD